MTALPSVEIEVAVSHAHPQDRDATETTLQYLVNRLATSMLTTLGIPASPSVHIRLTEATSEASSPVQLTINGKLCWFPRYLADWLNAVLDTVRESVDQFAYALSSAIYKTLACNCKLLWGTPQAAAYRDALLPVAQAFVAFDREWLEAVLGRVLELRISIADRATVLRVLAREYVNGTNPIDVSEALITELRPKRLSLSLSFEFLKELTAETAQRRESSFVEVAQELGRAPGLTLPSLMIAPTRHFQGRDCVLDINHLQSMPLFRFRVLPADEDVLQSLRNRIYEVLRQHAAYFVDTGTVKAWLGEMQERYPVLYLYASVTGFPEHLTRVARALVSEDVPVRNLRLIVERMLEFGDAEAGALDRAREDPVVFSDLVAFVRMGLNDEITAALLGESDTLPALIVDAEMERHALSGATRDLTARQRIVTGFVNAIREGQTTVAICSGAARPHLRAAIADDYPQVQLVGFDELRPTIGIADRGRVTLVP